MALNHLWIEIRQIIGVFAFLGLISLVGKYQSRAWMRRRRINYFTATLGIILLLSLLGIAGDEYQIKAYEAKGVATQAVITEKFTEWEMPRFGGTSYGVDYSYTDAAGISHSGEGWVHGKLWGSMAVGKPIAVEYLRDRPQESVLSAWDERRESIDVGMALAFISAAGLWWVIGTDKPHRRHAKKGTS